MTKYQAVIPLAQHFSTNTIKNLHEHNVSKKYLERMQQQQHKHANNFDKLIGNASMIPIKHLRSKVSREDSSRSEWVMGFSGMEGLTVSIEMLGMIVKPKA